MGYEEEVHAKEFTGFYADCNHNKMALTWMANMVSEKLFMTLDRELRDF